MRQVIAWLLTLPGFIGLAWLPQAYGRSVWNMYGAADAELPDAVALDALVAQAVETDLSWRMPLGVLLSFVVFFLWRRHWRAAVFPLLVVQTALMWCMCALAVAGLSLEGMIGFVPPLIFVGACFLAGSTGTTWRQVLLWASSVAAAGLVAAISPVQSVQEFGWMLLLASVAVPTSLLLWTWSRICPTQQTCLPLRSVIPSWLGLLLVPWLIIVVVLVSMQLSIDFKAWDMIVNPVENHQTVMALDALLLQREAVTKAVNVWLHYALWAQIAVGVVLLGVLYARQRSAALLLIALLPLVALTLTAVLVNPSPTVLLGVFAACICMWPVSIVTAGREQAETRVSLAALAIAVAFVPLLTGALATTRYFAAALILVAGVLLLTSLSQKKLPHKKDAPC